MATSFASGICTLFLGGDSEACLIAGDEMIEHADLADCISLIQRGGNVELRSVSGRTITPFGWAVTVEADSEIQSSVLVCVEVQLSRNGSEFASKPDLCWLQANSAIVTVPIPLLGLPLSIEDPADFFTGLVVLAERYGHLKSAVAELTQDKLVFKEAFEGNY